MKAITALAERDQQMLRFERDWHRQPGAREQAISDTFGVRPNVYYIRLYRLLQSPAAAWWDPMTVNRLRRLQHDAGRLRRWWLT